MVHLRHYFTKELVGETGLVFMYQRWYLPEVGVFNQKDKLVSKYGGNRYAWGPMNPVVAFDPNGLAALDQIGRASCRERVSVGV